MEQNNKKPIKRRFSLEVDFMNYKTNDLLYAFMRGLSTARPEIENGNAIKTNKGNVRCREYLPVKTFKKNKKMIADICGISTRQIDNQIKKLAEVGLIDEGIEVIEMDGKEFNYPCYWFPYDYDENYQLVDIDVIRYLVNTRNTQCIRIYIYLLNKYKWKKDYVFTLKELKSALGYADTTMTAYSMIKDILASFSKEGIIKYTKIYDVVDIGGLNDYKPVPVERMKLEFVAESKKDLPHF